MFIVLINRRILCYGRPPSTMDAVSATIFDDWRAESDSSKTVQPLRMAAHVSEAGNPLNPHRRGGKRLTVVVMFVGFFCVGRRPQYCTIPTVQNLQSRMFFVPPARILISAKLLILNPAKAPSVVPFRRGSLHWIGKIHRSVAVGRANGSPLW